MMEQYRQLSNNYLHCFGGFLLQPQHPVLNSSGPSLNPKTACPPKEGQLMSVVLMCPTPPMSDLVVPGILA